MSSRPWEADRPLTRELARRAVAEAFPDVDVGTIERIGSGWEFDAYLTRDRWVFRFPRRAEGQDQFERERPILDLVRARLGPRVAVPLVERVAPGGTAFPYAFAGHRFIGGVPADSVAPRLRPRLAESIGAMLGAIHAVPPREAREAGVREVDRSEDDMRAWFERGMAGASRLVGVRPEVEDALGWVQDLLDPLQRLDAPLRFIHQDLSPEHILVDSETGSVTGVLDWTDAILGDAARDFVILVAMGGWAFVDEVLGCYPHQVDDGFRRRLRFMARLLPLMWLGETHEKGEDVSVHLAWVRNAFAE